MSIDIQSLENLIGAVYRSIQHWEATAYRVTAVGNGGTPPTIGSDDDTRVFAFGPTAATAAYVAQFRPQKVGQLRAELGAIELPTYQQLQQLAEQARKVAQYRGISRLFSKRPVDGEQALAVLQSIDTDAIQATLSGIDAALGSTPTGEFTNLGLESFKDQIGADLSRVTGWPITWVEPGDASWRLDKAGEGYGRTRPVQPHPTPAIHLWPRTH